MLGPECTCDQFRPQAVRQVFDKPNRYTPLTILIGDRSHRAPSQNSSNTDLLRKPLGGSFAQCATAATRSDSNIQPHMRHVKFTPSYKYKACTDRSPPNQRILE